MNEGRLGKGLDRLLGEDDMSTSESSSESSAGDRPLREIPIDRITTNPYQPREQIDPDELEGLVNSIREEGVLQPILVRAEEDDQFTLAAGERRFRAARKAGLDRIPAVIKELPERRMLEIALVENVQREDLNPIEEARALDRLFTEFDLPLEEISSMVGLSGSAVSNKRRLLNLDDRIRDMIEENALTGGHARALLALSDAETRFRAAQKIVRQDLSVRNTEKLVRNLKNTSTDDRSETSDDTSDALPPELQAIRETLEERVGARVQIQNRKRGGEIQIRYGSSDELNGILERLEITPPQ